MDPALRGGSAADLWAAAQSGDARTVAVLLQGGADPNAREGKTLSPLHWAVWKGHVDIVQLLLQAGADHTALNKWGKTPLHWASWLGHGDVARVLMQHGAASSKLDDDGWTPLHLAARFKHGDTVRILLENGAPPNARDRFGQTARELAKQSGYSDIVATIDTFLRDPLATNAQPRHASGANFESTPAKPATKSQHSPFDPNHADGGSAAGSPDSAWVGSQPGQQVYYDPRRGSPRAAASEQQRHAREVAEARARADLAIADARRLADMTPPQPQQLQSARRETNDRTFAANAQFYEASDAHLQPAQNSFEDLSAELRVERATSADLMEQQRLQVLNERQLRTSLETAKQELGSLQARQIHKVEEAESLRRQQAAEAQINEVVAARCARLEAENMRIRHASAEKLDEMKSELLEARESAHSALRANFGAESFINREADRGEMHSGRLDAKAFADIVDELDNPIVSMKEDDARQSKFSPQEQPAPWTAQSASDKAIESRDSRNLEQSLLREQAQTRETIDSMRQHMDHVLSRMQGMQGMHGMQGMGDLPERMKELEANYRREGKARQDAEAACMAAEERVSNLQQQIENVATGTGSQQLASERQRCDRMVEDARREERAGVELEGERRIATLADEMRTKEVRFESELASSSRIKEQAIEKLGASELAVEQLQNEKGKASAQVRQQSEELDQLRSLLEQKGDHSSQLASERQRCDRMVEDARREEREKVQLQMQLSEKVQLKTERQLSATWQKLVDAEEAAKQRKLKQDGVDQKELKAARREEQAQAMVEAEIRIVAVAEESKRLLKAQTSKECITALKVNRATTALTKAETEVWRMVDDAKLNSSDSIGLQGSTASLERVGQATDKLEELGRCVDDMTAAHMLAAPAADRRHGDGDVLATQKVKKAADRLKELEDHVRSLAIDARNDAEMRSEQINEVADHGAVADANRKAQEAIAREAEAKRLTADANRKVNQLRLRLEQIGSSRNRNIDVPPGKIHSEEQDASHIAERVFAATERLDSIKTLAMEASTRLKACMRDEEKTASNDEMVARALVAASQTLGKLGSQTMELVQSHRLQLSDMSKATSESAKSISLSQDVEAAVVAKVLHASKRLDAATTTFDDIYDAVHHMHSNTMEAPAASANAAASLSTKEQSTLAHASLLSSDTNAASTEERIAHTTSIVGSTRKIESLIDKVSGASNNASAFVEQLNGRMSEFIRHAKQQQQVLETRKTMVNAGSTRRPATHYRVLRSAVVRQKFDRNSKKVGILDEGTIVEVLESRQNELGQTRIRCKRGWLSVQAAKGSVLLEPVSAPGYAGATTGGVAPRASATPLPAALPVALPPAAMLYKVTQSVVVRSGFERTSPKVGTLEAGETVTALAVRQNHRGQPRMQTAQGGVNVYSASNSVLLQAVPGSPAPALSMQASERTAVPAPEGADRADAKAFVPSAHAASFTPQAVPAPAEANMEAAVCDDDDVMLKRLAELRGVAEQRSTASKPNADSADAPQEVLKYRTVRKAIVRAAFDPSDSAIVGELAIGDELFAVETRMYPVTGQMRIRLDRGWTSLSSKGGDTLLEEVQPNEWSSVELELNDGAAERMFRAIQRATVRTGCDPSTPAIGTLEVGEMVCALEICQIQGGRSSGVRRLRCVPAFQRSSVATKTGWVSIASSADSGDLIMEEVGEGLGRDRREDRAQQASAAAIGSVVAELLQDSTREGKAEGTAEGEAEGEAEGTVGFGDVAAHLDEALSCAAAPTPKLEPAKIDSVAAKGRAKPRRGGAARRQSNAKPKVRGQSPPPTAGTEVDTMPPVTSPAATATAAATASIKDEIKASSAKLKSLQPRATAAAVGSKSSQGSGGGGGCGLAAGLASNPLFQRRREQAEKAALDAEKSRDAAAEEAAAKAVQAAEDALELVAAGMEESTTASNALESPLFRKMRERAEQEYTEREEAAAQAAAAKLAAAAGRLHAVPAYDTAGGGRTDSSDTTGDGQTDSFAKQEGADGGSSGGKLMAVYNAALAEVSASASVHASTEGGASDTANTIESLPPPWEALTDEEGNTYYYNSQDESVTWELPQTDDGSAAPTPSATSADTSLGDLDSAEVVAAAAMAVDESTTSLEWDGSFIPDSPWLAYTDDDDGAVYFHNIETEEVSWEFPVQAGVRAWG